jgi:hypothetical protein
MDSLLALEVFPAGVWQTILGHCDSKTFAKLFVITKAILLDSHNRLAFQQRFRVRLSFMRERRFVYLPVPFVSLLIFEQKFPQFRIHVESSILFVDIKDKALTYWNLQGDRIDYSRVKMLDILLITTTSEQSYDILLPTNFTQLRFRFINPFKQDRKTVIMMTVIQELEIVEVFVNESKNLQSVHLCFNCGKPRKILTHTNQ